MVTETFCYQSILYRWQDIRNIMVISLIPEKNQLQYNGTYLKWENPSKF